jgi:hypothetical protein
MLYGREAAALRMNGREALPANTFAWFRRLLGPAVTPDEFSAGSSSVIRISPILAPAACTRGENHAAPARAF